MLRSSSIPVGILFAMSLATAPSQAGAAPERYRIDTAHTQAAYEYTHLGISRQQGRFESARGRVVLDPTLPSGGEIEIELDATSLRTGNATLDELLRSEDYFDAANHPLIRFRSTRLRLDGESIAGVEGELTIREVTRPLKLTVDRFACRFVLLYLRRACGANAYGTLRRSDFGLDRYTSFVSDEVTLLIAVEAIEE